MQQNLFNALAVQLDRAEDNALTDHARLAEQAKSLLLQLDRQTQLRIVEEVFATFAEEDGKKRKIGRNGAISRGVISNSILTLLRDNPKGLSMCNFMANIPETKEKIRRSLAGLIAAGKVIRSLRAGADVEFVYFLMNKE